MRQIRISLRTPAQHCELDLDDHETAQWYVKGTVGWALAQLLGSVIVEEVTIEDELAPDGDDDAHAWHPP
jgi:hypothetical protein